ncbi:NAD(P)-binding protein [Hygrophoropsis aurantiaca]|uniref:NAD(P)-binding protein n=1 Tax=Hygrophoropsis aurantiaca TaxID=72124 RepID=A0ACB8AQ72_9AGAM|nr:NAD(P)-binding protein [Hygrophoropsis aurantiaca]
MSPRVWLITGSSTGLGRAVTELLLENGEIVVATLRKPEALSDLITKYPAQKLLVVQLDVKRKTDVDIAFAKAKEAFGRVDIVVNNAGYGIVAEIEGTSEDRARDLFEVNFWGAAYITREAVRFFREENKPIGGRILQVSSKGAIDSNPGTGFYNASTKALIALEGLSEALVSELDPSWNIKITIVQPGPFRTKAPFENAIHEPPHPAYTKPDLPTIMGRALFKLPEGNAYFNGDPKKFAAAVLKISSDENPPLRLPLQEKTVEAMKQKIATLSASVDEFASWSNDLNFVD